MRSTLIGFSPSLLRQLGYQQAASHWPMPLLRRNNGKPMLGRKKIEELAGAEHGQKMTAILQEILEIWGKHQLSLPEAMDIVMNLQAHLNRQHLEIMRKKSEHDKQQPAGTD